MPKIFNFDIILIGDKMDIRKVLPILLVFILTFSGCNQKANENHREKIEIRYSSDNTVNGYRTQENGNDIIGAESVEVEEDKTTESSPEAQEPQTDKGKEELYCANISTKKFHFSTCGSVKTMKDENKMKTSDRQMLIDRGYSPCKICNP